MQQKIGMEESQELAKLFHDHKILIYNKIKLK